MTAAPYILNGILLTLLLGIGGLLLWFHVRLNRFLKTGASPLLSGELDSTLKQASAELEQVRYFMEENSGNLNANLEDASKMSHEIKYMLDRAEKLMSQLDSRFETYKQSGLRPTPPPVPSQAEGAEIRRTPSKKATTGKRDAIISEMASGRISAPTPTSPQKTEAKQNAAPFQPRPMSAAEQQKVLRSRSPGGGAAAYGASSRMGTADSLAVEQASALHKALKGKL